MQGTRGEDDRVGPRAFGPAYRLALQRSIGAAAVPYGFTILNVAAGGVLIQTHGPPRLDAALLFICGAITGFTVAAVLVGADGGARQSRREVEPRWFGLCSGAAALVAFACATVMSHAIDGPIAFGMVGLTATSAYLAVGALTAALLEQLGPPRCGPPRR